MRTSCSKDSAYEMMVLTRSGALLALPQHFLLDGPCELWKPDFSSPIPASLELQEAWLQSLSVLWGRRV